MAINRTAYNALVDDTGGGVDGTIVNKALLASVILDPIDAEFAAIGSGAAVEQTTTVTGTNDDFSLVSPNTYLRCNNATPLYLTGFLVAGASPASGARFILDNVGTSTVRVGHEAGGSSPAARVITGSVRGQIIGAGGRLMGLWDNATGRWRLSVIDPGAPIPIAYNAADFTASAGTWTVDSGDVETFAYQQRGAMVTLFIYLNNTSISGGTPGAVRLAMPNGFVIAASSMSTGIRKDNGTWGSAAIYGVAAGTYIGASLDTFASWAASTNLTNLYGTVPLKVN